jgi:hypothetical protein
LPSSNAIPSHHDDVGPFLLDRAGDAEVNGAAAVKANKKSQQLRERNIVFDYRNNKNLEQQECGRDVFDQSQASKFTGSPVV